MDAWKYDIYFACWLGYFICSLCSLVRYVYPGQSMYYSLFKLPGGWCETCSAIKLTSSFLTPIIGPSVVSS